MNRIQPKKKGMLYINETIFQISIIAMVLIFILSVESKGIANKMNIVKENITCKSFSTWSEANLAWKKGAKYLDGNKNQIPCEELYKRDLKGLNEPRIKDSN